MNSELATNPVSNLSTDGLQKLNAEIYSFVNDQHFPTEALANRLLRYSTRLLRAHRNNNTAAAGYYLAMALSWSLALANRLHFSLEERMWIQHPFTSPPKTFGELQKMLAGLFPDQHLDEAVSCFAENTAELIEAIENFKITHGLEHYAEIQAKLAIVLVSICTVATRLKLDLAGQFEENFRNGCPKCRHTPCGCGFTVTKFV